MTEHNEDAATGTETTKPKGRRHFLRGAGAATGAIALGTFASTPAAATHQTVVLGEDKTFTELNRSKAGEVVQGALVLSDKASTANRDAKRIRTYVEALTGIGSARLWGEVGQRFFPEGDEAQLAEIETKGRVKGDLRAIANSGSSAIVHVKIVDFTDETVVRDSIFRKGGFEIIETSFDSRFSGSVTTQLKPGHNYTAWVRLTSRVDTLSDSLNVLPESDCFKDDRGAVVDEISVKF